MALCIRGTPKPVLMQKWIPRWDAALCCISSCSTLFVNVTRKTITCVTCYKRRCWKVLMSNNRWRIIMKFFFAMRYTLKLLWNESLSAWRFANKLFNQTVAGKQAFVNTCYLQSFMKTNTCPQGKKKLDCITSLGVQYLNKKKYKKKSAFVSSKMISHAFSSFR